MKNDEISTILSAISHLLTGPLAETESLILAEPSEPDEEELYGFHRHENKVSFSSSVFDFRP